MPNEESREVASWHIDTATLIATVKARRQSFSWGWTPLISADHEV